MTLSPIDRLWDNTHIFSPGPSATSAAPGVASACGPSSSEESRGGPAAEKASAAWALACVRVKVESPYTRVPLASGRQVTKLAPLGTGLADLGPFPSCHHVLVHHGIPRVKPPRQKGTFDVKGLPGGVWYHLTHNHPWGGVFGYLPTLGWGQCIFIHIFHIHGLSGIYLTKQS